MSSSPDLPTLLPQIDALWSSFKIASDVSTRRMVASDLIKLLAIWESENQSGVENKRDEFTRSLRWINTSDAVLKCITVVASGLDAKKEKLHESIRSIQVNLPLERAKSACLLEEIESEERRSIALGAEFATVLAEGECLRQKLQDVTRHITELTDLKAKLQELQELEVAVEASVVAIVDGGEPTPLARSLTRMQVVQEDIVKYYRTWHSTDERIVAALTELEHGSVGLGDIPATLQGLHGTLRAIDAKFKAVMEQQGRMDAESAQHLG